MSIENVKKLELCKKLLHESLYIESDELGNKMFDDGYTMMKELASSQNVDVLAGLFDLFTDENENGVCETLESEIFENYTMEQVIEALYKKFPELVANNEMRAEHFAGACISRGYFEEFRNIFNSTHTFHYENFFAELSEWIGEDYPEEISILWKDMEAWPKK